MAAPVWVLSVDLQAKTATFASGMSEAAKSARGAFTEIKSGSGEMGREVNTNMFEARHGVMLLSEEFGIKLPRALTAFITSIGPVGAAMEAAFPFLAIAVGATLLIEHLSKMHEAGQKLTEDQVHFGTAVQNAFTSLDDKLLQAGIRSDELRNDHMGALAKQLELIDHQSMAELVKQFDALGKESDVIFAGLKAKWYSLEAGSDGAKASLARYETGYAAFLAKGDSVGASGLLQSALQREQKILDLQRQAQATAGGAQTAAAGGNGGEKLQQHEAALAGLKQMNSHWDEQAVASQVQLVATLSDQIAMQGKVGELKKADSDNAKYSTAGQGAGQAAAAARAAADSVLRIDEEKLAASRESSNAELTIARASGDEREAVELAYADKELQIRLAANDAQIAALNHYAEDYPNQLKALHEKAEELEQQHATAVAGIRSKSDIAQNAQELQNVEQGIRESIDATQQGSAARLAAIDAALKTEASRGMQDLSSYRDLLAQRVQTTREAAEEEAKLQAEAGKEAADNDEKMGELTLASEKERQQLLDSAHRVTIQQRLSEELQAANAEYALKLTATAHEMSALDKSGKDYENKLKAIQDKQKQLIQQHENEVTAIKDKAETERNSRILSADQTFNETIGSGLTQVLMGHKSFAATMDSIGNQVVSGMMQNAIKSMLANDFTKESDAAAAARKAYLAGSQFPFPANVVMGPLLGAAAFAAVMAFEDGGVVPGTGRGDVVPAMLEPGEGVVPRGVMDGLSSMARSGTMGGGNHYHAHTTFAPKIHAVDADGVDKMLTKHAATFQKHLEQNMRRMNR